LVDEGSLPASRLDGVLTTLGIDPDKPSPLNA
jgi:hypothetical protein